MEPNFAEHRVSIDRDYTYLSTHNLHESSLPEPVDRLLNHLSLSESEKTRNLYYTDCRFPPSVLKKKPASTLKPVVAEDHGAAKELKVQNNNLSTTINKLMLENQSLRDKNAELDQKLQFQRGDIEKKFKSLIEDMRNEVENEHSKSMENEIKIKKLQQILDATKSNYESEQERGKEVERKLEGLIHQHGRTIKANSLLVKRSKELDSMLDDTNQSLIDTKRNQEQLASWKIHNQRGLEDYKCSLVESGLNFIIDSDNYSAHRLPLQGYISALKSEHRAALKAVNREIKELKYEIVTNSKNYVADLASKESKVEGLDDQLRAAIRKLEEMKIELVNFREEKRILCADKLKLENDKKHLVDEMELKQYELLNRTNLQIKDIRENYEADKYDMRIANDKLQEKNIELQAEIGQLIRDRRAVTNSYYQRDPRLKI
ncbi:hypothetical protein HDV01_002915 [Terramyces sp. JEL0728]|nr:hypothetical protein HDV01_002915 [Terramyces sp. JEL0728]